MLTHLQVFDFERWAVHRSSRRYIQHIIGIPKVLDCPVSLASTRCIPAQADIMHWLPVAYHTGLEDTLDYHVLLLSGSGFLGSMERGMHIALGW